MPSKPFIAYFQTEPLSPEAEQYSKPRSVPAFISQVFQLLLLAGFIFIFGIEKDSGLIRLFSVLVPAFILNQFIPYRFRFFFFLLASLTGILVVTGLNTGLTLILFSFLICFLAVSPLPLRLKKLLFILLAIFLACVQLNLISFWGLNSLIPFLGTFFMFRMIIFLYELGHIPNKPTPIQSFTYFFLFPNICFPLFPVVDLKDFLRHHFDREASLIYQKGLRWIGRGVLHLLLYRFIYNFLAPNPYEVHDLKSLCFYIFTSYPLILRLSGMFYLALGTLFLFGFNLGDIFDNYFLARSFSDLWRRINIYWRAFMLKVFYYPILFRLRKMNQARAMFITTLIVFVITWALHAYQWFWLRADVDLRSTDVLFWAILGICIALNGLYQFKFRKAPALPGLTFSWKRNLLDSLKIMFMLAFMCFLWSLWTSSSISEWKYLLSKAGIMDQGILLKGVLILVLFLVLILGRSYILYLINYNESSLSFKAQTTQSYILIATLGLLAYGAGLGNPSPVSFLAALKEIRLNQHDKSVVERGYYQQILGNANASPGLWKNQTGTKAVYQVQNKMNRKTDNILQIELIPDNISVFKGQTLSTNSLGMRDYSYSLEKPPGKVRIALLGGSYELGSGVGDREAYKFIAENEYNASAQNKLELLNFSDGGYTLPQAVYLAEHKVQTLHPDAILYALHSREDSRTLEKLVDLVQENQELNYNFLKELVRLSGARKGMSRIEIYQRLKPFEEVLFRWGLLQILNTCLEHGEKPILLYLPVLGERPKEKDNLRELARSLGFQVVDLSSVYEGHDQELLEIGSWDTHPNADGHRVIGKKLAQALKAYFP